MDTEDVNVLSDQTKEEVLKLACRNRNTSEVVSQYIAQISALLNLSMGFLGHSELTWINMSLILYQRAYKQAVAICGFQATLYLKLSLTVPKDMDVEKAALTESYRMSDIVQRAVIRKEDSIRFLTCGGAGDVATPDQVFEVRVPMAKYWFKTTVDLFKEIARTHEEIIRNIKPVTENNGLISITEATAIYIKEFNQTIKSMTDCTEVLDAQIKDRLGYSNMFSKVFLREEQTKYSQEELLKRILHRLHCYLGIQE